MLAHLKRSLPSAEVHLLANDYNAWVIADSEDVDVRWVYPRVRVGKQIRPLAALTVLKQTWQLRAQRFDWAIVANGSESKRAIERGIGSRAGRVVAYVNDNTKYPRLSDPLPQPQRGHESDRLIALLQPLGVEPPSQSEYPTYRLPQSSRDFALDWLRERGVEERGYVVIGLGARRAKKQPSAEQIARWSHHFKHALGLDTVFMWTPGRSDNPLYPGDDEVAEPVLSAKLPNFHPFRGPLQPALGLIWSAKVSIFPDSGLMHFAAASPGGVLGLFAETDVSPSPDQWGPRGKRADYLEAQRSVTELPDDLVFERITRLIA